MEHRNIMQSPNLRVGSQRAQAVGSAILNSITLPWGSYETIRAKQGCFSAVYNEFAFVYTRTPSHGPVKVNSDYKIISSDKYNQLSLFCPRDCVSGCFEVPVTYDIMLIAPEYFDQIIREECSLSAESIKCILRGAPHTVIAKLWSHMMATLIHLKQPENIDKLLKLFIYSYFSLQVKQIKVAQEKRGCEKISSSIEYIRRNIGQKISVTDLAMQSGFSKFHFIRAFRNLTGVNPYQFILNHRLEKSRELLENPQKSIVEIAHECGFNSQSHLTTCFKRAYKKTPAKYRCEIKSAHM